ncbi:MAG: helix-turn-helix domain-containing protein [Akkermansia sp.]
MKYEEIKAWLKKSGMSRKQFGGLVGVSVSTVNNWLAGVFPIPEKKMPLILAVIEREEKAAQAGGCVRADELKAFPVLMAEADYERCLHAADAQRLSVSDWAADVLAAEAAAFIKKEQAEQPEQGNATA